MRVSLFNRDHLGEKRFFKSNGLTGAFYLTGNPNGRPIIILHGLTGNHIGMLPMSAHLSNYLCILPDLPGHANSPIPPAGTNLLDLADWFLAFVNQWEGALVIAHSYGGSLALLALSVDPAATSGCILLNPVADTSRVARVYRRFMQLLRPRISAMLVDIGVIKRKRQLYLLERSAPDVLRIMQQLNSAEATLKTSREQMAFFQEIGQHFDNPTIFKDAPRSLTKKTFCVVASRDSLVSPHNTAFLQKTFGKNHVYKCNNSGHLMPIEAIDDTAKIIKKILKRVAKPAPRLKAGLAGRPKS